MRKAVVLVLGLVALALFSHQASAAGVSLTKQQVETVCGSGLKSGGNVSGCKKKCGLNGEHECEYSCYKGKECRGDCSTCGVKRTVIFPNLYAKRVVRQSVRAAP